MCGEPPCLFCCISIYNVLVPKIVFITPGLIILPANPKVLQFSYQSFYFYILLIDGPIILWWTPFKGHDNIVPRTCGNRNCFVTQDRHYLHHNQTKVSKLYSTFECLALNFRFTVSVYYHTFPYTYLRSMKSKSTTNCYMYVRGQLFL